ncbi:MULTISPECIES: DUF3143 domain-containing protein [Prochlorococcus]|uniref:DUF3143 domain-containing protein n=1 Tax=Prochlorococcus TaxID=1218 RepID=UPI000533BC8E|nr:MULTISPECIES: DUF3143 domain-containing protein [Prochlorococcus]KGG13502.1 hypothetical protein EV05_0156 [Prochlorococcus sp. MIT 0601]
MLSLPPAKTPLNQHSLGALEFWLSELGATKSEEDPCIWFWVFAQWSAEIEVGQDELRVIWIKGEQKSQFGFPYGLSRQDVEDALKQGP